MPPLSTHDGRPPLHPGSLSSYSFAEAPASSPPSSRKVSAKFPISPIAERVVAFSPVLQITEMDYSHGDDKQHIWYTFKDMEEFEKQASEVALRMTRKTLRRGECVRGLEQRTPTGYRETMSSRINGVYAVLSEQFRQEEQIGVRDDVKLAQLYGTVARSAAIKAQDVAAVDALDAKLYQEEDPYDDDNHEEESFFDCWFLNPAKWLGNRARVAPLL